MTIMQLLLPVILWEVVNIMQEKTVKLFHFQSFCKANVKQQTSVEFSVIILTGKDKVSLPPSLTSLLTWSMMKIL